MTAAMRRAATVCLTAQLAAAPGGATPGGATPPADQREAGRPLHHHQDEEQGAKQKHIDHLMADMGDKFQDHDAVVGTRAMGRKSIAAEEDGPLMLEGNPEGAGLRLAQVGDGFQNPEDRRAMGLNRDMVRMLFVESAYDRTLYSALIGAYFDMGFPRINPNYREAGRLLHQEEQERQKEEAKQKKIGRLMAEMGGGERP